MSPLEHVALGARTTLGVGGAARWFVEATSESEAREALAWADERALPLLVLGGGSNMLVADRGFQGLVLRVRIAGVRASVRGDVAEVDAGAGERWDDLVALAALRGWAGVECLSGIPGDVGATPIQNVGAYGQEVAETITSVRVLDRRTGVAVDLATEACGFAYRDSLFKREAKDRYVVVGVRFALRAGGSANIRYGELSQRLAAIGAGASPPLALVRETVIALRRGKSMVLDPDDENGKSAGSFFMNPTVDAIVAASVRERALALGAGDAMPAFPAEAGRVKLSAAWLIERAGFRKGTSDGPVGISTRHALAIVNRGGASAIQILGFAARVRDAVVERFGVALAPEPVLVGFTPDEAAPLSR